MRFTAVARVYRPVTALLLACGGGDPQQGPPDTGTVRVQVRFAGTGTDPDGPVLTLDGTRAHPGVSGPVVYEAVSSGDHTIELTGLHARCIRVGPPVQTFTVVAGQTVEVSYAVDCRDIDQLAFVTYRPDVPGGLTIAIIDADGGRQHEAFTPRDAVAQPAWAPDGRRLAFTYALAPDQPTSEIWTVNADGTDLRRIWADSRFQNPAFFISGLAWSPDGSRLAVLTGYNPGGLHGIGTVFVIAVDGSGVVELPAVFDGDFSVPSWSPDGSRFVLGINQTFEGQPPGTFVMSRDGSNAQRLPIGGDLIPAWSPDGNRIAAGNGGQIEMVEPDGAPVALLPCPRQCIGPKWSPDSKQLASGWDEVVALIAADASGAVSIPAPGVREATVVWSPSGLYLAWRSGGDITISRIDGSEAIRVTFNGNALPFSYPVWRP